MKNTFAPYNYNKLMTAKIGKLVLDTNDDGEVINYRIEFVTIKELCSDPLYTKFNLNGFNIHEVFNLIAKKYKAGKIDSAKGMYTRADEAVQEYNDKLIQEITIDIKMNKDRYFEGKEFKERQNNHKVRWDQLVAGLPQNRDYEAYVAKLSDKDRALCLMRAADYGLTVPTTEMERKDVYTMRVAAIASEADDIHPFNTYHEVDDSDPVVTFVGRHKQSVKLSQDEDETILMAMWYTQCGDEFMEKCRPLYDIVYKSHYVTAIDILYTGTAAQCEAELAHYKEIYEDEDGYCIVAPSAKEITIREARLLGVDECDIIKNRDFNYDAKDILN